jgi:hypothetical protein
MAAGLQITVGPPVATVTVDSVVYTFSSGGPTYVPTEHRAAAIAAAAAVGVTLGGVSI